MSNGNDRSLKMLATALDMEEKGKVFYETAVQNCKNELGREIFRTLIKDELVHMDRIRMIYGELQGAGKWTGSWKTKEVVHHDLKTFFKGLAKKYGTKIKAETTDIEALTVGIGFEEKSIKFYGEELQKASDPVEKAFIERMVGEEKGHFAVLVETKQFLSDPASYFLEKERAGYDGA